MSPSLRGRFGDRTDIAVALPQSVAASTRTAIAGALSGGSTSQTLTNLTTSAPTEHKPQSKVWRYDDKWWGVFPQTSGTYLWRLDGTSWTQILKLSTVSVTRADTLPVGDVTHVMLYHGTTSELASVQYVAGTYEFWSQRPALTTVSLPAGVEVATIAMDSTGKMWLAADGNTNIVVKYSDAPYTTFSSPIELAAGVTTDDISVIGTLPNGTVGVMWSNQTTRRFGFRYHVDGADPSVWSADEVPASQSALNVGAGMADDHLNLAIASDSTLYAAVKTSYDTAGFPKIALLIRRPNGTWDNLYEVDQTGTRPIVVLNEATGCVEVAYTAADSGGDIVSKQSTLSPISFGARQTVTSGSLNNVSSSRQNATDEALFVSNGGGFVHGTLVTYSNIPNQPPVVYAGPDQTIFGSTTANLDGSAVEGQPNPPGTLNTTWTKVSGPGTVTFGNPTAVDTVATFDASGTYVLRLTATDGSFSRSDELSVVINTTALQSVSFQDGVFPTAGYTGTRDLRIRSGNANSNYEKNTTLGVDGSPDDAVLLKWDVSTIPAGGTVFSASITLNVTGGSTDTYEIYELKRDWLEAQATWNIASTGVPWSVAGADEVNPPTPDRGTVVLGTVGNAASGQGLTFALNSAGLAVLQGWINNPSSNFGFVIQDYINAGDDFGFSSSEVTTLANRPRLNVTYGQVSNAAPDAVDDSRTTQVNAALVVVVLGNDTDANGDALTVTSASDPPHGSTAINGDNTITYTPDTGYTGADSFTYSISDGHGGTDSATVNMTVNAPPDAVDDSRTTQVNAALIIAVLGNDTDANGDTLVVTSASDPPHGTTAINVDNTITYTPDTSYTGADSFTYAISDGHGGTDSATVNMTVNAPPDAVDDGGMTNVNVALVMAVLSNDTDPNGDSLVVMAATDPPHGSVAINVNNTITYTPDSGYTGADSFSYSISDGKGGTDSATVTLNVNAPPDAVDDGRTTNMNTALVIAVLSNDTDANGDSIVVTSASDPPHGSTVINVDNTMTYTPDTGYAGADSFTYSISDGKGGTDTATVTMNVNGPPDAVDDSRTTNVDTALVIAVLGNDTDPNGDSLVVTSATDPPNGSIAINPDNTITYTPDPGYRGPDSFTYFVSDGNGGSDSATVTMTVNGLPDAMDDGDTTDEDNARTIVVLVNDSDIDGDVLSVTSVSDPPKGSASVNSDGTISYTPDSQFNGTDSFTYQVSDGKGGTDSATVTVTVNPVNDAPSFTKGPNQSIAPNSGPQSVAGWATGISAGPPDESTQTVTFDVTNNNNALFSVQPAVASNGTLTFTPASGATGSATVTVTAHDDGGTAGGGSDTSAAQTFIITVNTSVTVSFQDGVNGYTGTRDATVRASSPTVNNGASTNLVAYGASDEAPLVKWDISSIASSSTVLSATITVLMLNGAAPPQDYEIYEVLRPWIETEVTWNQPAVGATWGSNGAQGAGDHGTDVLGTVGGTVLDLTTITLNAAGIAMVQRWVTTPGSNNGIIIQDYSATDWMSLASSEYSNVTKRPKLTITYQ